MVFQDMIICTSPQGKSIEESASYAIDFFELIKDVQRLNAELHHFDHLFYLLESPPCIKDHLPLHYLSYCVCEPTKLYACNWPILSQKASLLSPKTDEDTLGLPNGYVLHSGTQMEY